jgi:ribosomal protein S18 acetylase RimI-like enzyme
MTAESRSSRFVDAERRTIELVAYREPWFDSLHAMYEGFPGAQRTQGLPPVTASAIEAWLDAVLEGTNVLAVRDGTVVGHVMFVADDADDADAHELGVFVHQDYQGAGIGTSLLKVGFEHARRAGVDDVWLTVDRSNRRAHELYQRLGFTADVSHARSVRMSRQL